MRISDWSSDVCSSDLMARFEEVGGGGERDGPGSAARRERDLVPGELAVGLPDAAAALEEDPGLDGPARSPRPRDPPRSEERRGGEGCVSPGRFRGLAYH